MVESVLSNSSAQGEISNLLGLGTRSSSGYGQAPGHTENEQDVSVAGVMLLSAVSVAMAIFAMVTLALVVIGCWWVISHIPVPPIVMHILTKLHLASA
jgi:hypothetical protein